MEYAYCGDCDHGDRVGVEGSIPVGGASEHDGLELDDACSGVDICLKLHVKLVLLP